MRQTQELLKSSAARIEELRQLRTAKPRKRPLQLRRLGGHYFVGIAVLRGVIDLKSLEP